MDNVVRKLSLYVWPLSIKDTAVFAGFQPRPGLRSGTYALSTDATNSHYTLTLKDGKVVERGISGDSVGRSVGIAWKPSAQVLGPSRIVPFVVVSPRDVSSGLISRVDVTLPQYSQFIKLTLTGADGASHCGDSERDHARVRRPPPVSSSAAISLRNRKALADQLDTASRALRSSESALESFRKNTITLPSEAIMAAPATGMGAGGGTGGSDPMIGNYFGQKAQYLTVQHDIAALAEPRARSELGHRGCLHRNSVGAELTRAAGRASGSQQARGGAARGARELHGRASHRAGLARVGADAAHADAARRCSRS